MENSKIDRANFRADFFKGDRDKTQYVAEPQIESTRMSRRNVVVQGTRTAFISSIALLLIDVAWAAEKVCGDPKLIDPGIKAMRDSLNYTEVFANASKQCGVCAFFHSSAGGCGQCQIFSSLVNATGHCDSWSPKS